MEAALSDFQYSTESSPFMNKFNEAMVNFDYSKIKSFKLDPSKGVKPLTDLIPPPSFTNHEIPFNYSYQQNPAVKALLDSEGKAVLRNISAAPKILTFMVRYDVKEAPSTYPPDLPPLESVDPAIQDCVQQTVKLMEQRPIWTRRALANNLKATDTNIRFAFQYCGYMFRSGPWREALVRYGVDPRTDARYRHYQTLMFQMPARLQHGQDQDKKWAEERTRYRRAHKGKPRERASHIFDGHSVCLDGKVWQVCDITDPLLSHLLSTTSLRPTCDSRCDGWFHNGTWAKAKTIMKAKLSALLAGRHASTVDLARLLTLPDVITEENRADAQLRRGVASSRELGLASEIRGKAGRGHTGRLDLRDDGGGGSLGAGKVADERVEEAMAHLRTATREAEDEAVLDDDEEDDSELGELSELDDEMADEDDDDEGEGEDGADE
ncbi:MAG: tau 95 subunit of transcription factor TFIIIC [Thelocarpon impressellum]|nr:MAG: tau 95 subunit of transcription factor TFIIIC [Thelocarpon impressellum]